MFTLDKRGSRQDKHRVEDRPRKRKRAAAKSRTAAMRPRCAKSHKLRCFVSFLLLGAMAGWLAGVATRRKLPRLVVDGCTSAAIFDFEFFAIDC